MTNDSHGLHHIHQRKRNLEPYPHPNKFKRFIDNSIYIVCMLGPIMTIPQLLKIWVERNASGVSLVSWIAYLVVAIFWLMYGIAHKEKPIILMNATWIILEIFIITGIVLYG